MLVELFVIVRRIKIREGSLIENKIVGIFLYKMSIFTKYHLFRKNIMKTITNDNSLSCYMH